MIVVFGYLINNFVMIIIATAIVHVIIIRMVAILGMINGVGSSVITAVPVATGIALHFNF